MIKYAKISNKDTGLCEVGINNNADFYISLGMKKLDVKQSDIDGNWYLAEKCPMKSKADKTFEENQIRISEIKHKLENIDKQKIRAISEPEIKDESTGESWLDYYNNQAKKLREELKELENDI